MGNCGGCSFDDREDGLHQKFKSSDGNFSTATQIHHGAAARDICRDSLWSSKNLKEIKETKRKQCQFERNKRSFQFKSQRVKSMRKGWKLCRE
jgi:hypothetical protein